MEVQQAGEIQYQKIKRSRKLGFCCVVLNSLENKRKKNLIHSKVRAHMLKALETLDKYNA